MFKRIVDFGVKCLFGFTLFVAGIELLQVIYLATSGMFKYLNLLYSLIGCIGAFYVYKRDIKGKWLLWVFYGLQIIITQTLDFHIGFDSIISVPLSFNFNSTENGQLTKLVLFKIDLLAIFWIHVTNKFYSNLEQLKSDISE